jgi:hypothetical protein
VSAQAVASVFRHSRTGGTTRLVLLAIANYYGDRGAWPSIDSLARDTLMSRRAVQDCIRRAEQAGELRVEYNAGENGTNRYFLLLEGVQNLHPRADSRRESAPEPKEVGVRGSSTASASSLPTLRRRRDEVFETIAAVCSIDWHELTRSARGEINAAAKQIREATPGVDPPELRRRAAAWPYQVPLTPSGLAKHWPKLGRNGQRRDALAFDEGLKAFLEAP